jgi:membrane fusion protein, heavy metal efflux system
MSHRVLFISTLIIFCFFPACRRSNDAKPKETGKTGDIVRLTAAALKEVHIETVTAQAEPFRAAFGIPAKVMTNQDNEALVGSLVQGRVSRLLAKTGDRVRTGQVLMTVDGLEIGSIKAAYLKAKANLDYTDADLRRHKTLSDQNIGSKQSLLEAQAEHEKALAEFNAEDKKIHSIGLSDADVINSNGNEHSAGTLPIRSPIGGVVVERNVVLGQLVDVATNAFRIINTGTVWIDGQLAENRAGAVIGKEQVEFTTSSLPGEIFHGHLQYVSSVLDEQTRSVTVRGEFANGNGALKPLMFGELKIQSGVERNAILLPSEAIMRDGDIMYVFVMKDDTTFEKRPIMIGADQGARIEIVRGIAEGEHVVVKGAFYLKSDLKKEDLGE